jgi:GNAT superfamily N-acetyltransferase
MAVRPMRRADRVRVAEFRRGLGGADGTDDGDETVLVWEGDGGAADGFVSMSLRPWAEGCAGMPVPYVEGWYVAEHLRGRGIGRALMEGAEGWARSQGFDELGSDVRVENTPSLRAHQKLGFVPTERRQFFRKDLRGPAPTPVRLERHTGQRGELRALFAMAEDSAAQLDAYLDAGELLVAVAGDQVVGHLQLIDGADPEEAEIKNMAVAPSWRGRGIGLQLIGAAIELGRARHRSMLVVATAAADVDNLRFYQRAGFRLRSVERDAFMPAMGYAPGTRVDGIVLRDRVWLDRDVDGG